jgi:primosomal protein N' (replication factor Y)
MILGPASSPIPRIKDRYRYQCVIKYKHEPELYFWLQTIQEQYQQELKKEGLQVAIDFHPNVMM